MASGNNWTWELPPPAASDPTPGTTTAAADCPSGSTTTTTPGDGNCWPCHFYVVKGEIRNPSCTTVYKECRRLSEHFRRVHKDQVDRDKLRLLTSKKKVDPPGMKWEQIRDLLFPPPTHADPPPAFTDPSDAFIDPRLLEAQSTQQQP